MNIIRAFIIGALVGFVLGVGLMVFLPLYHGELPRTLAGFGTAVRDINWIGVWFLTALFGITWAMHEFRVVRALSNASREFSFWRDVWNPLTFWRR